MNQHGYQFDSERFKLAYEHSDFDNSFALAGAARVNVRTIYAMQYDDASPSTDQVFKVSQALGVEMSYLLRKARPVLVPDPPQPLFFAIVMSA